MEYEKVLVPLDGSRNAERALKYAKPIAINHDSKLIIFTCIDTRSYRGLFQSFMEPSEVLQRRFGNRSTNYRETLNDLIKKEESLVQGYMKEMREEIARDGVKVDVVVGRGDPAKEIARMAKELGVDLVLMASQGLTGRKGILLGSVARSVLEESPVPVFIVK